MNRLRTIACSIAAAALISVCAAPAVAQSTSTEKPTVYTWVTLWGVPRANWPDYLKGQAAADKVLEKGLSDGSLMTSGAFTVLLHQEGAPTHGRFFTAKTMSADLKVLEDLKATSQNNPVLNGAKHSDELMQSRHYGYKPGTYTNAYMRVQLWGAPEGASDPGGKVLTATVVPMLDKLLANGALYMYQIDEQAIHTADPGRFYIVMVTNGPEGQDAVNAAIEDMQKNHPETAAAYGSLISGKGHRDDLYKLDSLTIK